MGRRRGEAPSELRSNELSVPGGATPYLQLLHDPCLTPKIAETENKDGADLGTDRVTGGNTGAGAGVGSVTRMRISRRCCISFVLK